MAEQRSKPYPAINLEDAVKKIEEVVRKLGNSKKYDKDTFAIGLGYKSAKNGAFLRTSAALIQYGLVLRDGNDYSLSPLSQAILLPTGEDSRDEAIKEAALGPQVFRAVYETYIGQELPALLPNIMVADYGILVGAKDKIVSIFKATMEYAGLLKGNSLVGPESTTTMFEEPVAVTEQENEREQALAVQPAVSSVVAAPVVAATTVATTSLVKDFGEGRVASLTIPTDLSDDERDKLATLIKNM